MHARHLSLRLALFVSPALAACGGLADGSAVPGGAPDANTDSLADVADRDATAPADSSAADAGTEADGTADAVPDGAYDADDIEEGSAVYAEGDVDSAWPDQSSPGLDGDDGGDDSEPLDEQVALASDSSLEATTGEATDGVDSGDATLEDADAGFAQEASADATAEAMADAMDAGDASVDDAETGSTAEGGGPLPVMLADAQANVWGLAVDRTNLYFALYANPGAIVKVPIAGGTPTTLAPNQLSPINIATDGKNVYWTNYDMTGAVMAVDVNGGFRSRSHRAAPHRTESRWMARRSIGPRATTTRASS
jgi:hypothetical protein